MAQELVKMYEKAQQIGGAVAKMRLAILTGIPSSNASITPDSPENIQKFKDALKKLEEEFKKK